MPEREDPEACPNCGGRLPPGAEACPNCPWSLHNEDAAEGRRRTGWQIPAPVAFVGLLAGIGLVGWHLIDSFVLEQQRIENARPPEPVKRDDRVVMDTKAVKQKPNSPWKVTGRVY